MKWWEKTVEYTFVLKAAKEKIFNLFMPLDGNVESIGDTVVCNDSEFFIIEFKKSLTDLSAEYSKYENGKAGYLLAAEEMKKNDASHAHFLIGGKEAKDNKYLELEISKYFELDGYISSDINVILEKGISLEQLKEYTKKITSLKVNGDSEGDEGSSSGGFANQSVLAVSRSKKKGTLIPLHYFKPRAPKKDLKKNITRSSTPTRGMF
ncbi:hypothetical protein [Idiomarina sp.]|uniref:hypothetical protein n=1 Tax=Idiomarina sp. TaxID=1874361 RepID=UPI003A9164F8